MPRKTANPASTTTDNYDGPARHTRGAQRSAIANANPVAAPVAAPVQQQASVPATQATRSAGAVRAAVKKQTKAAATTAANQPKKKTTSTRKPAAAVKTAVAPSPTKVRATRATAKKISGNPPPKSDRQLRKQPSRSVHTVKINSNKDVDAVDDDEGKSNDVPPLQLSGYMVIGAAPAVAPVPTNADKIVAPAPLPSIANPPPLPSRRRRAVVPVPSTPAAAPAVEQADVGEDNVNKDATAIANAPPVPSTESTVVNPPAVTADDTNANANANAAITANPPPLPTRGYRLVVPRPPSFRPVFPRPDTPKPKASAAVAQRANLDADDKTLSSRDQNVDAQVDSQPISIDFREESQDLADVKHEGNENARPVFEGADAIVDAFNYAGRANGLKTPARRDSQATGKAKANAGNKKTAAPPPLPYRPKAGTTVTNAPPPSPSPGAPAAAVPEAPPLPYRPKNARQRVAASLMPVTPGPPPSPPPMLSRLEREEAAARARAAATASAGQRPAGTFREVRRSEVKTVLFKVKVEEEDGLTEYEPTDEEENGLTEYESTDEEEVERNKVWHETLPTRLNRTSGWAQARQASLLANPGKRRREDESVDESSNTESDSEDEGEQYESRFIKKRRIAQDAIKAECADEGTPAKSISQAEKKQELVKSRTGSWGLWSSSEPPSRAVSPARSELSQEI